VGGKAPKGYFSRKSKIRPSAPPPEIFELVAPQQIDRSL